MITRDDAAALMESKVKNINLRKHIYAVEAGMVRLAEHFGEDAEIWGLTGLLHDLDYDKTAKKPSKHTFITEEWLKPYDLPQVMIDAIRCAKLALNRGQGGALEAPSAYFYKHPPRQFTDNDAFRMTNDFINNR